MIKYTTELNTIDNFDAWSGGKDVLNKVRSAGKIGELDEILAELMDGGEQWTETQLNDFLWFDLTDGNYDGFSWDELDAAEKANNE